MAYEVGSASLIGLEPGYIAFIAGCEPGRVSDVYSIMRSEIDALRGGRVDPPEVDRARSSVLIGELEQLQAPADYATRSKTVTPTSRKCAASLPATCSPLRRSS
jgi:hypothetical protein